MSKYVKEDDLIVLISARKGATSFMNILENLPTKIEKYFPKNNRIVIYPKEFDRNMNIEFYNDVSAEPLTKGIEVVQKFGKGIGSIFKKSGHLF